jgi:hypothetical protein
MNTIGILLNKTKYIWLKHLHICKLVLDLKARGSSNKEGQFLAILSFLSRDHVFGVRLPHST